jgi:hypothetical protein
MDAWSEGRTLDAAQAGRVIGYNAAQMVFEFTMIDKTGTDVECQISSVAMDQLAGGRKGTMPAEREAQIFATGPRVRHAGADVHTSRRTPDAFNCV